MKIHSNFTHYMTNTQRSHPDFQFLFAPREEIKPFALHRGQ